MIDASCHLAFLLIPIKDKRGSQAKPDLVTESGKKFPSKNIFSL
jgi:hypothetical protein